VVPGPAGRTGTSDVAEEEVAPLLTFRVELPSRPKGVRPESSRASGWLSWPSAPARVRFLGIG
jgi:hypothetical protein